MGPREPTRRQIIGWLAAAEQAEHAEIYHTAAANPEALDDRLARQAARDAAAMQLIELAGCAEEFTRERGEPGTTLARLDDALRPLFKTRVAHVHPELGIAPPAPVTPGNLAALMGHLKGAILNLDSETLKIEPAGERQALNAIYDGLIRIEKDGLPDPEALRPRDLHYAGYYHEIQFGRLAKATGLYENRNSPDPRHVAVNRSIFDADDMAHKFHAMRAGPDKSRLPVSVVSPEHRDRVPGRLLSELMRELRHEYQRPQERLEELAASAAARAREEYRDSVRGLAQQYVRMTGDADAAASIHDYMQRQKPPLDRPLIEAMRQTLQAATDPAGDYLGMPEAVRNRCLDLCFALDSQGDGRLLDILDAADARGRPRKTEAETLIRGLSPDRPMSKEAIDYDPWAAVYQPIPPDAGAALLRQAYGVAVQCAGAVAGPPEPASNPFAPVTLFGTDQTREQNFERAARRVAELSYRLRVKQKFDELLTAETAQSPASQNRELAGEPAPSLKAKLAEEILAQESRHSTHAHYDIGPWQGGFAVFRIYDMDDAMLKDYGLPTGQQVLGWAETPDRLFDAILDGSAFTPTSGWITDEQMIEADEHRTLRLAEAIDDDRRRHSDDPGRESIDEDREALYDTETGERLSSGGDREALYDTETGERLDGGEDREAGHDRGGGPIRTP
jgi:hypothetical protein